MFHQLLPDGCKVVDTREGNDSSPISPIRMLDCNPNPEHDNFAQSNGIRRRSRFCESGPNRNYPLRLFRSVARASFA